MQIKLSTRRIPDRRPGFFLFSIFWLSDTISVDACYNSVAVADVYQHAIPCEIYVLKETGVKQNVGLTKGGMYLFHSGSIFNTFSIERFLGVVGKDAFGGEIFSAVAAAVV